MSDGIDRNGDPSLLILNLILYYRDISHIQWYMKTQGIVHSLFSIKLDSNLVTMEMTHFQKQSMSDGMHHVGRNASFD